MAAFGSGACHVLTRHGTPTPVFATVTATQSISGLSGPRALPMLGNAKQLRPEVLHLTLERWADEFGTPFRIKIGTRTVMVIADPVATGTILRDRPDGFRRWSSIKEVFEDMHMGGVFSAEGDDWKRKRRLAVEALNTNHLNRYFTVIHTATDRLRRRWVKSAETGASIDIRSDFMSYTVDVTSALAFGVDLNTLERGDSELQNQLETIFPMIARRLNAPVPYWRWIRLPADRGLERSLTSVRSAVLSFVADARQRIEQTPELRENPTNFRESMLVARDEDSSRYSEEEIIGNTYTMLVAGEDTTANTLAWTTWLLAQEVDAAERLSAESDQLLGEDLLAADFSVIAEASYAEAVVKESMRLKPVAPVFFLEAIKPTRLCGVEVPADRRLLVLTRHHAMEDDNFPEPARFDPLRRLNGNGAKTKEGSENGRLRDQRELVPFGAGPRFCPGRNLALVEAKSVMTMLARNFDLELIPGEGPVEEVFAFTMMPRNLRVRLRARQT